MTRARSLRTVGIAAGPLLAVVLYLLIGGFGSLDAPAGVTQAFRTRGSGIVVEDAGTVLRLLPDDTHGSRHQRFIVALGSGGTVLVSHNIDLADRIDTLRRGDTVTFRGEYEWNERGGVVHWTHHDPAGRRTGGWIRHADREYR